VEGDNWMITQQTASYLIKKMDTTMRRPVGPSKDPTEELFSFYRGSSKPLSRVVDGNAIDNDAIVEAFKWRAAELVSLLRFV
jgi:acyl-CoA oxidase